MDTILTNAALIQDATPQPNSKGAALRLIPPLRATSHEPQVTTNTP